MTLKRGSSNAWRMIHCAPFSFLSFTSGIGPSDAFYVITSGTNLRCLSSFWMITPNSSALAIRRYGNGDVPSKAFPDSLSPFDGKVHGRRRFYRRTEPRVLENGDGSVETEGKGAGRSRWVISTSETTRRLARSNRALSPGRSKLTIEAISLKSRSGDGSGIGCISGEKGKSKR
ncbi:hypothetical protein G9A89_015887 [Geosiphon pyriformis]|nr:hypothetical protein G9A89_015887 [Geosiphon pyriformis]